jgi:hypothetical protein
MKNLLTPVAVAESAMGLALLVVPSVVVSLLFGGEASGVSIPVARVTGIALLALGVGCWPGPARFGMLTYNALVAAYLFYLGVRGEWIGPLLWPAAGAHAVLTLLLAGRRLKPSRRGGSSLSR